MIKLKERVNQIKGLIDKGATINDIIAADAVTYLRYKNGIRDMVFQRDLMKSKEFRDISITLIFGGMANDRTDFVMKSNDNIFRQNMSNGKPLTWDDYCGQKILFLDNYNFDIGITPISILLCGYSTRLNTNGGHTFAQWTKIIISFNYNLTLNRNDSTKVFNFDFFEFAKPGMKIKKYRRNGEWMTKYIKKKAKMDRLNLFFSLVKGAFLWDNAYSVNDIDWNSFVCHFHKIEV